MKLSRPYISSAIKFTIVTSVFTVFLFGCSKTEDSISTDIKSAYQTSKNFSKSNQEKPPELLIFEKESVNSACGPIDGSAFCPADNKIYIEKAQLRSFSKIDPVAVDLIVAHEYAHAMQHAYGFGRRYTVLNELQADCLAGAFLSDKYKGNSDKIQNALLVAWNSGDFEWQYQDHHGFPNQRLQAFMIGMGVTYSSKTNGILKCLELF